jgi:hypothetical protein
MILFQNCPYFSDDAGDYENVTVTERRSNVTKQIVEPLQQQQEQQQQTGRSFSPPR